jgi:hypothetical protein
LVSSEKLWWVAQYEITKIERENGWVVLSARYTGPITCPACGASKLRSKGRHVHQVRHESWGERRIGSATVERWFQDFLLREKAKLRSAVPRCSAAAKLH